MKHSKIAAGFLSVALASQSLIMPLYADDWEPAEKETMDIPDPIDEISLETDSLKSAETEKSFDVSRESNIQNGSYVLYSPDIPENLTNIVFTNIKAPENVECLDLSIAEDNSIVGWNDGDIYYISTQKPDKKMGL
ncbi:hypothetical protein IM774_12760 [Erysipelotrichaceae bacterium RD49]|nr:hypothetical protein [Erysipelotrichaceae bacterium RD49]